MSEERINYLIRQYANNRATEEEIEDLFTLLKSNGEDESLQLELMLMATTAEPDPQFDAQKWEPFIQKVLETKSSPVRRMSRKWWKVAGAAVAISVIALTAFLLMRGNEELPSTENGKTAPIAQIVPGKNGAVLTLADGRQIVLDSAGNGTLTAQGKTTVAISEGRLIYSGDSEGNKAYFNTMTTPKGRKFQLVLPDGSSVWLNAASSITYPTIFSGNTREVTITGEAYFEVAKDRTKPFHVKVNSMDIEVLGTHFNVNAYSNESDMKTTLFEGSVKVNMQDKSNILKPGQQAIVNDQQIRTDNNADLDQVLSWKNDLFNFNRANLQSIMKQLERWYDIEVVYEGNIPEGSFRGKVSRNSDLSDVLNILKDVGIRFKIEGKKIIVGNSN